MSEITRRQALKRGLGLGAAAGVGAAVGDQFGAKAPENDCWIVTAAPRQWEERPTGETYGQMVARKKAEFAAGSEDAGVLGTVPMLALYDLAFAYRSPDEPVTEAVEVDPPAGLFRAVGVEPESDAFDYVPKTDAIRFADEQSARRCAAGLEDSAADGGGCCSRMWGPEGLVTRVVRLSDFTDPRVVEEMPDPAVGDWYGRPISADPTAGTRVVLNGKERG